MTIDWLGLGRLEVSHYPTGRNAVAPKGLKSYFINTVHAISTYGVPIEPGNPIVARAILFFANGIVTQDLMFRAAISQPPEQLARALMMGE